MINKILEIKTNANVTSTHFKTMEFIICGGVGHYYYIIASSRIQTSLSSVYPPSVDETTKAL